MNSIYVWLLSRFQSVGHHHRYQPEGKLVNVV